ncbi:hypothetical protein H0Z60_02265 [Ectothiorhodospiraceae bacterium WFHF3C12]|nr:hypothetical protein [Ectothiorhodospiraceae bacterium WFHF3C12]
MEERKRSIDCRFLLGLYAVVPLAVGLALVDHVALGGHLNTRYLPREPAHWPFWTVIFGLPHIIASMVTMADREYLAHYRGRLLWPLLIFAGIAAAGLMGPQPLGRQLLFIFIAFYTIYHVLSQQLGLTLVMMGIPPSQAFKAWKWLSIFTGFVLYTIVYGREELGNFSAGGLTLYEALGFMAAMLSAALLVAAYRVSTEARHAIGVWYLWGNVALILSAFLVLELGYTVFVILMPRVIHDLTAFAVYITHDANRNRDRPRNLLYRLTRFTRLPPVVVLPLLSVGIAYAMTTNRDLMAVNIAVVAISFLHYYMEGFIWRGPTPHRSQIAFGSP